MSSTFFQWGRRKRFKRGSLPPSYGPGHRMTKRQSNDTMSIQTKQVRLLLTGNLGKGLTHVYFRVKFIFMHSSTSVGKFKAREINESTTRQVQFIQNDNKLQYLWLWVCGMTRFHECMFQNEETTQTAY